MLTDAGDDFIFTCKETSHKALYDFIDGAEPERIEEKIRRGKAVERRRYRWIAGVPLRDGKDAALVSWIGFEIFDGNGRVKYSIAWVTSLPVSKDNVAEIAACGRARWKIENETFNVMKNHGYELEHNFGHGETFLAMTLAALNLLAFPKTEQSIAFRQKGLITPASARSRPGAERTAVPPWGPGRTAWSDVPCSRLLAFEPFPKGTRGLAPDRRATEERA